MACFPSFMGRALLSLVLCAGILANASPEYILGIGKADITGPVADINLMGYANPSQIAGGIHTRLFARAFIAAEAAHPQRRIVFVNLDACMASQAVTFTVIERLKQRYGPELYTEQNVALSGTHTHSGPAGYLQYLIYDVTGLGFVPQTFNALVDGIVQAIVQAHEGLRPGSVRVAAGELLGANINRSPTAYLNNPPEERQRYSHDVDKVMTLLRLEDESGRAVGAFSWFPVHGTSINNTNALVNGDNKGAAAQFMERWAGSQAAGGAADTPEGGRRMARAIPPATSAEDVAPDLVAAFCQANVGDTSPNTLGAFCMDTGLPCDAVHSTCGGRVQQCIGRGPGWPDHFNSTRIIAGKQTSKAQELLVQANKQVNGPIESRHVFLDMRGLQVGASQFTGNRSGSTCKPAMGFAFAAGTTDGPGAFDFTQSDTNGTAFWRLVRNFIKKPSPQQEECHAPKPILLDVGDMHFPYEWVPYIVEIHILRLGSFAILAVPGELTTMAGRRLVAAVRSVIADAWGPDLTLVIAGLTNTYSSYVTTWEEYQVQRYEGGFTQYGPLTLDAYIQEFMALAAAMVAGKSTPPGPSPPNLLPKQWSLVPGVVLDGTPWGKTFGGVSIDVQRSTYSAGDTVSAEFYSACPRNNIRAGGTFLTVERQVHSGTQKPLDAVLNKAMRWLCGISSSWKEGGSQWEVVHTDNDWETTFAWYRHARFSSESFANVSWQIPADVRPGTYRLRHFGDAKHFLGHVAPFEGSSSEFQVAASQATWLVGWTRAFTRMLM